ncbi:hypothetical protein [Uliginosibacterium sediminicola]|uniref:hypothetical protein n=1 Tax=Uliginosibacterium sediminicola TaxID=2024550 RepID=UPI003D0BC82E
MLATHRALESETAAALSVATFELRALSRAGSLRQAQLAMIKDRLSNGPWRHPFYWAPYAFFG